ncbi:alcohol dehydrogenase catalytic domain-containing protein [Halothiobacillus sp.]|uniref:alcohol dehydrogenase catalytic domain-containing protein n=1 Tax=Halothiobacillus sp. TaxID=1891311 RepID=UPI00260ADFF9|nr:alcohol dehydrogenase catalytic domain-containing protein [Halothiobacillus sp.]MDD4965740.1 alcohol dehydrogenase catalytic domain-containing protein [Halothiobacillus sp.]
MKGLFVDGAAGLLLREEREPAPQPGQLRIRATCSLVSGGTELHYIKQWTTANQRSVIGYCSSGVVDAVGEGVREFAVGDRVIAMGWGYARHAEVICVPYRYCVKIPDSLPFERAVFANLAATSLHAVHRALMDERDRVLVIGAGLVGQLVAQIARSRLESVLVADTDPRRCSAAESAGCIGVPLADATGLYDAVREAADGKGVSKIFLCMVGKASETVSDALRLVNAFHDPLVRPALVAAGRFDASLAFSVDMGNSDIRYAARCGTGYRDDDYAHGRAERTPPPGEGRVDDNLRECVAMITDGRIRPELIHDLQLPFSQSADAYGPFESKSAPLGVTFSYPGGASL